MELQDVLPKLSRTLRASNTPIRPPPGLENGVKDVNTGWSYLMNIIDRKNCLNKEAVEKLKLIKESIDSLKCTCPDPYLFILGLFINTEESHKKLAGSLKMIAENVTLRHVKELNQAIQELNAMLTPKCRKEINKLVKESNSDSTLQLDDKVIYNVSWEQPDMEFLENLNPVSNVDRFSMSQPVSETTKVDLFWLANELKSKCPALFSESFTVADCLSFVILNLDSTNNDGVLQRKLLELFGQGNIDIVHSIITYKEAFLKKDILAGAKNYAAKRNAQTVDKVPDSYFLNKEVQVVRVGGNEVLVTSNFTKKDCDGYSLAESKRKGFVVINNKIQANKPPLSTNNSFAALARFVQEPSEDKPKKSTPASNKEGKSKNKKKNTPKETPPKTPDPQPAEKVQGHAQDEFSAFGETLATYLRSQNDASKVNYIKGKIAELILQNF